MTTLTIKSDSERKLLLLVQLAEELGLEVNVDGFEELEKSVGITAEDTGINVTEVDDQFELEKNFFRYIDN